MLLSVIRLAGRRYIQLSAKRARHAGSVHGTADVRPGGPCNGRAEYLLYGCTNNSIRKLAAATSPLWAAAAVARWLCRRYGSNAKFSSPTGRSGQGGTVMYIGSSTTNVYERTPAASATLWSVRTAGWYGDADRPVFKALRITIDSQGTSMSRFLR